MFNFTNLVTNTLLKEQTSPVVPDWLQNIIKKHSEVYSDVKEARLESLFGIANKRPRPSAPDLRNDIDAIRIIDILKRLADAMDQRPTTYEEFLNKLQETKIAQMGTGISDEITRITAPTKADWGIKDITINNQYKIARADADKTAAAALSIYNSKSVLEATKQIVTKRTNLWDRIGKLKSPTQPFTNLINDIFKFPKEYMSGSKKISSDFEEIVDSLYIQNLFRVGLAAKELFAAELANLKMSSNTQSSSKNETPEEMARRIRANVGRTRAGTQSSRFNQQTQNASTAPSSGVQRTTIPLNSSGAATRTTYRNVNASLDYFEQLVNSVLINEVGVLTTISQGMQRGAKLLRQGERLAQDPEYRQRYEDLKKRLKQDQANYDAFLNGKPIQYKKIDPTTKKETNETGTAGPYTVRTITEMETPEAVELITALRAIAEYVRKGVGVGQRIQGANQALQGIWGMSGQKLYN